MGTGLNCTRLLNCTRTKLHEAKFAQGHKIPKLHEDSFASRVNFAQVTFFHETKSYKKYLEWEQVKTARRYFCTKPNLHKGTKLHKGLKLLEDNFATRINFAELHFYPSVKK